MKRRGPRAVLGGVGVLAIVVVAGLQLLLAVPSPAHNWDRCGNGLTTKYYRGFTPEDWPNTWSAVNQNALENARQAFNVSDFQFNRGGETLWYWIDSVDPPWAGLTTVVAENCSGQSTIIDVNFYLAGQHMTSPFHTMEQRWCTIIHEMGHLTGLGHNSTTSIMNDDHSQRCHSWEIKQIQSHDLPEINSRY
jgi:hypothetical protein